MLKEFLMILSMWGQTASGGWSYIGNQYIYNTPMTLEVCQEKIKRESWSIIQNNEYYLIRFDCMHISKEGKGS